MYSMLSANAKACVLLVKGNWAIKLRQSKYYFRGLNTHYTELLNRFRIFANAVSQEQNENFTC